MTAASGRAPLVAVYPGTFDPITKGHLSLIRRASRMVDRLVVSVSANQRKSPLFSLAERVAMASEDIKAIQNIGCPIEVIGFDTLLLHHVRSVGATCIIRGLRAVSDFEYEFQLTGMNARMDPSVETLFLMASETWQFVSSSFVKEIALLGGEVSEFVTPATVLRLAAKKNA